MESVRGPTVGPPDRRQVWEAASQYPFHCRTYTHPKLSPAGWDQGDNSGGWQTN